MKCRSLIRLPDIPRGRKALAYFDGVVGIRPRDSAGPEADHGLFSREAKGWFCHGRANSLGRLSGLKLGSRVQETKHVRARKHAHKTAVRNHRELIQIVTAYDF